jgi:hypothetical protein
MDPELHAIATRQSGVFTTAQALDVGIAHDQIRTLASSGTWVQLRRGIYVEASVLDATAPKGRHALSLAAIQLSHSHPIAASHFSAAWLHNLPLIQSEPQLPHVTAHREHFRALPDARLFNGALKDDHVTRVDGLLVTSIARTISDIGRTRALDDAVVMLEHALRTGLITRDDYTNVLLHCPTWKGIATSKRALQLAEPLNETPGESLSYLRMQQNGLPLPRCQVELQIGRRRVRLDYLWPWAATAGEFDGRGKYATREDLYAEKQREDDLRSIGLGFARWGWHHLFPDGAAMAAMAAIIRRALGLAQARPQVAAGDDWRQYLVA